MSSKEEIILEDDFICLRFKNDENQEVVVEKEQPQGIMQFHFCLKGNATFYFNKGSYEMKLPEEKGLILYNPQRSLPYHVKVDKNSWVISVLISVKKFHALFSTEAEFIPFLNNENRDKKHYAEVQISPSIAIVLNQIMNFHLNPLVQKIYYKAKVYELMSLLFNTNDNEEGDNCPFRADEDFVIRIKQAKDILLRNMIEPPTLQELADEVGLNLKKLKQGFKQIYGETVYGFLFDYKMDFARKLLDSGTYNVNEVGIKVGYSTASHFIAAFKKKYGTTPKKYLMSINMN
nr:AraC family transcriptional regulator [uncultured Flavobacterium sp.]